MSRSFVLFAVVIIALTACADPRERVTAQDALAFGYQETRCRDLKFKRVFAQPAALETPTHLCGVVESAVNGAVDTGVIDRADLHPDSVAAIIVTMRSIQEDRSSTEATEIGVIFDLVHESWNLIVWIRGDSILDVAGVPKGLRY